MNKKILAAAIAGALVAPLSAQAIKFKVSGHVHRAIRFVDTGDVSDIQFTDDTSSRTRLRAVGSEDIGNGMKAGIYIEFGVVSNRSDRMDIKQGDGADSFGADIRHSALWFGGNWGTVWLGQTSSASDGDATQNFVTGLSDEYEHVPDDVASVRWRKDKLTAPGVDMGDTHYNADGGRRDILRYDTPKFGPVQVKVAVGNNEFWDVGAYAGGGLAGGKYKFGIGYSSNGNNDGVSGAMATLLGAASTASLEEFGVSAGFQFSQGTSIQGSYSDGEGDDLGPGKKMDADAWAVKLGHSFGNNQISVSYGESNYDLRSGVGASSAKTDMAYYGIGFQHTIKKAGVDLHANYHHHTLDLNSEARTGLGFASDPDDIDKVMVGARVRFN